MKQRWPAKKLCELNIWRVHIKWTSIYTNTYTPPLHICGLSLCIFEELRFSSMMRRLMNKISAKSPLFAILFSFRIHFRFYFISFHDPTSVACKSALSRFARRRLWSIWFRLRRAIAKVWVFFLYQRLDLRRQYEIMALLHLMMLTFEGSLDWRISDSASDLSEGFLRCVFLCIFFSWQCSFLRHLSK